MSPGNAYRPAWLDRAATPMVFELALCASGDAGNARRRVTGLDEARALDGWRSTTGGAQIATFSATPAEAWNSTGLQNPSDSTRPSGWKRWIKSQSMRRHSHRRKTGCGCPQHRDDQQTYEQGQ